MRGAAGTKGDSKMGAFPTHVLLPSCSSTCCTYLGNLARCGMCLRNLQGQIGVASLRMQAASAAGDTWWLDAMWLLVADRLCPPLISTKSWRNNSVTFLGDLPSATFLLCPCHAAALDILHY